MKYYLYITICLILSVSVNSQIKGTFNIDINQTTVSGISSGGFMAVQMHFAYSSKVKGCGVFAGGPYWCAQGKMTTATQNCMSMPLLINVNTLISYAQGQATAGKIDSLSNLKNSKVYLYSGTKDTVVNQGVVKKAQDMYARFNAVVTTDYTIPSEHAYITNQWGNNCSFFGSPYINNCQYNGALESLKAIISSDLNPPTAMVQANLISFDQSKYVQPLTSMDKTGYYYAASSCLKGTLCKLHVVFHGCQQGVQEVGQDFVLHTGLNEVAEANNLIILYPQAVKSQVMPFNPQGCWDWWGYTDQNYANQESKQMDTIWQIIESIFASGQNIE